MMLVIEKITLMVELYPPTVSLALQKKKLISVFHNSWNRTIFGNGKCTNVSWIWSMENYIYTRFCLTRICISFSWFPFSLVCHLGHLFKDKPKGTRFTKKYWACQNSVKLLTITLLYTGGHYYPPLPLPTLKPHSSNRKVWFGPIFKWIGSHGFQLWTRPRKCFRISTEFDLCKLWRNDKKQPM